MRGSRGREGGRRSPGRGTRESEGCGRPGKLRKFCAAQDRQGGTSCHRVPRGGCEPPAEAQGTGLWVEASEVALSGDQGQLGGDRAGGGQGRAGWTVAGEAVGRGRGRPPRRATDGKARGAQPGLPGASFPWRGIRREMGLPLALAFEVSRRNARQRGPGGFSWGQGRARPAQASLEPGDCGHLAAGARSQPMGVHVHPREAGAQGHVAAAPASTLSVQGRGDTPAGCPRSVARGGTGSCLRLWPPGLSLGPSSLAPGPPAPRPAHTPPPVSILFCTVPGTRSWVKAAVGVVPSPPPVPL